jgi:hypothetical protein
MSFGCHHLRFLVFGTKAKNSFDCIDVSLLTASRPKVKELYFL